MSMKTCRGPCGLAKSLEDEFSKDPSKADGHRNVCRTCDAARRNKNRGKNADHPTEQQLGGAPAWAGPNLAAFDALQDGVPVMITQDMRRRLREHGVADDTVAQMTPEDAWEILRRLDCSPGEETTDERRARERAEKEARAAAERERRLASDFEPLRPEDFDSEFNTGVANVGGQRAARTSAEAAREKRQEFNEKMGRFAVRLRDAAASASDRDGEVGSGLTTEDAAYIRDLAEAERRFGNRRAARSIALIAAHERLNLEANIYVAEKYFSGKVEPVGYARFPRPETPMKRTACLLLSDLHLGSELDALDEPVSFKAVEEARRLEWILRQFVDFKPQHRDTTEALIIINGDVIEGMLLHDLRSGAPLTEQKAIFWKYFTSFVGYVAAHFKSVRIVYQPGNHGRDKLRHPGRATASKWDGAEWGMGYALMMMCSELKNVSWDIPFRAISIVDLHGSILGVTHGDTEVKLGDPDTKARDNFATLSKINSTNLYGVHFDAWAFGHYHKPRWMPGQPSIIWNGALVPPNGHARTSGYFGDVQGQFCWEAVEGHPIGDVRFIEVGPSQDNDERLGSLIKPFRFSMVE